AGLGQDARVPVGQLASRLGLDGSLASGCRALLGHHDLGRPPARVRSQRLPRRALPTGLGGSRDLLRDARARLHTVVAAGGPSTQHHLCLAGARARGPDPRLTHGELDPGGVRLARVRDLLREGIAGTQLANCAVAGAREVRQTPSLQRFDAISSAVATSCGVVILIFDTSPGKIRGRTAVNAATISASSLTLS